MTNGITSEIWKKITWAYHVLNPVACAYNFKNDQEYVLTLVSLSVTHEIGTFSGFILKHTIHIPFPPKGKPNNVWERRIEYLLFVFR
jgi:hypothetical protein